MNEAAKSVGELQPEPSLGDCRLRLDIDVAPAQMPRPGDHSDLTDALPSAQIPRATNRSASRASASQRRFWLLSQRPAGAQAYHMTAVFEVSGPLNEDVLEHAIVKTVERHEVLRTYFEERDGDLYQCVAPRASFVLERAAAASEADAWQQADGLIAQAFDLRQPGLLRAGCFAARDHVIVVFVVHHIVCDGWSVEVLLDELKQRYEHAVRGGEWAPISLPIQYQDWSAWQHDRLTAEKASAALAYWRGIVDHARDGLEFPADHPRPLQKSHAGAVRTITLSRPETDRLRQFAADTNTSPFIVLLAILRALVVRYTGILDFPLGLAVSGRDHPDAEAVIGPLVNTVVHRAGLERLFGLRQYVRAVAAGVTQALQFQDVPFDYVLEQLQIPVEPGKNPVFEIMAVTDKTAPELVLDRAHFQRRMRPTKSCKFDLLFMFHLRTGSVSISIEYATDLFTEERINRLADHFRALLTGGLGDPEAALLELPMLTREESALITRFNATTAEFPRNRCLHQLFETTAEQSGDRVALQYPVRRDAQTWDWDTISYRDLNARSNRLAWVLRNDFGVGPDVLVALICHRSLDMLVAILAILKAGGAYVPVDPRDPASRIREMLSDCRAPVVLTNAEPDLAGATVSVLNLKDESCYRGVADNLPPISGPNDLAYCIFTSGSTGRPKGVLIEHRGLVNRLAWMHRYLGLNEQAVVLQKTVYTFDVSVWELLLPGIIGAKLVMLAPEAERDAAQISTALIRDGVTVVHFVPSMLSNFLRVAGRECWDHVRHCICSGEALSPLVAREFFTVTNGTRLHNLYGPTEATVDVSATEIHAHDDAISIGSPVANTEIYVANQLGTVCPPGVRGEIVLAGVQLARAYLNQPALTAEKFTRLRINGKRIRCYRTGDIGRLTLEATLEYGGRRDDQVKVRGFRIELKEIEHSLRNLRGVTAAAVTVHEINGRNEIFAYYCSPEPIDRNRLRSQLAEHLPAYMLPRDFIRIGNIPTKPNGKLQRDQLPPPTYLPTTEHQAASTFTEVLLAQTVAQALSIPIATVNMDASLSELGGHSLHALEIANAVRDRCRIRVDLLAVLLGENTLASIAAQLDAGFQTEQTNDSAAGKGCVSDQAELGARLLSIDREIAAAAIHGSDPAAGSYYVGDHIRTFAELAPHVVILRELECGRRMDDRLLARRIYRICGEQSLLHSRLTREDGRLVYREHALRPSEVFHLPVFDLSGLTKVEAVRAKATLFRAMYASVANPIDADVGRFLIYHDDRSTKVIVALNHVVGDAYSMHVVASRLFADEYRTTAVPYRAFLDGYVAKAIRVECREAFLARAGTREFVRRVRALPGGELDERPAAVLVGRPAAGRQLVYYALWAYARLACRRYGLDAVPVKVFVNQRYGDFGRYGETVGDFHDEMPVVMGQNPTYEEVVAHYDEHRRQFFAGNVHLRAMAAVDDRALELTTSPFILNVIGLYGASEAVRFLNHGGWEVAKTRFWASVFMLRDRRFVIALGKGVDPATLADTGFDYYEYPRDRARLEQTLGLAADAAGPEFKSTIWQGI